uniref:Uncharacterized protein n=1 Tax=Avena sativa TaxID=4498 RepID=A0ACD5Z132_AVESA
MVVVEAVAVGVVGWFVTPNIAELMRVARDCAVIRYKVFSGNKEKLGKLAQELEEIKHLLDQASTTFVQDQSRLDGLWRLKDDIHDAEEILDQFVLEIKATNGLIDGIRSNRISLSAQLAKVLKNLEKTRLKARELPQLPRSSILRKAETGPSPVRDKRSFFGYHDEYNQLYSMLEQQPDGNSMSKVIAIVGHGGMGKTELARQAFRDAEDKFDLRIWVHAYSKNTEFELLQEIWRSVAGDRPVGEMNVTCLQNELEKLLASKRCLLVLDDVWNHESATCEVDRKHAWHALQSFTRFAGGGSRIVMTTRAKICSTTFQADASIIFLDGMKPDEITRLVNDTAANVWTDCSKIQDLLDKQVPKLKGSPLAAVEIGDELKGSPTSPNKCCEILEDIEQHLGSVLSCHLYTYRHLPPHLQRCFEFCSIFPDNWKFEREKLTRMWIAHGFVEAPQQEGPSLTMEDIARGYFDSLVGRSLFQEVEQGAGGGEATYVIHEQIHWMIRLASAKNCISISAPRSIPATVRHLSVTSACFDQLKECRTVLNNVRTLLILKNADGSGGDTTTIDKGVLKLFKGVRVLDLTQTGLTQLPGTIGKLKHVRYLGLPSTMRTLCEQLTGLLFLQTFSVSSNDGRRKEHTCQLQKFPKNMNRLVNMRHLDINTDCITNISGIGSMVKLQGSIVFKVMKGSEKEGHGVSELAKMSYLSGALGIKGLDAVASKEEAMAARLASKGKVKVLKLEWGASDPRHVNEGPTDAAAAVLEGLQPHCDLRDLRITRYPGTTFPSWLVAMEKLTCLYLRNCRRLKALPALGGLPCLELLDMKELTIVKRIDGGFCGSSSPGAFPSLKTIVLDDMPELVAWDDMPKGAFPLLSDISIIDCPKLSLSGLALEWCRCPPDMRVKGCPAITPGTLPKGVSTCKFN